MEFGDEIVWHLTEQEEQEYDGLPALHWAAREGNDQLVAELLAAPGADVGEIFLDWNALHYAATRGHDKVVAQLLEAKADLIDCGWNPLHMAALNNHEKVVTRLLAARPELVDGVDGEGWNSLHFAARGGNQHVVAILLATKPSLMYEVNSFGSKPLRVAADWGHDHIVAQLLAFCPRAIDDGDSALLGATYGGHIKVVTHLLTTKPSLAAAVEPECGSTALHIAAARGDEDIVDMLLSCKPMLIYALDHPGNTILHEAIRGHPVGNKFCGANLIERLWRLNTDALWTLNTDSLTPFQLAITKGREFAIDMFQWKLSWDDIVSAFTTCRPPRRSPLSFVERYRPLIAQQCEGLLEAITKDLMGIVFEFLGLTQQAH